MARFSVSPLPGLLSLLLIGCESCGQHAANTVARDEPLDALVYDVHEWGLVDVYASGLDITAGSPRMQRWMQAPELMVEDKPIVYFHYVSGDFRPIEMHVGIPGGELREVWPSGQANVEDDELSEDGTRAAISGDFVIAMTQAPECLVPGNIGGLCRQDPARDRYCERAELGNYQANDASCLQVWRPGPSTRREVAPFFFYRGAQSASARLSVTVQNGDITQVDPLELPRGFIVEYGTNDDGTAAVDDVLVATDRRRAPDTQDEVQDSPVRAPLQVQAPRIYPQDIHVIPQNSAAISSEEAAAILHADLVRIGLTDSEAQAFMGAWTAELFEGRNADGSGIRGRVLLYWLPQATVSRVATVSLTPAPRNLRRAMLVRVHL